MVATCEFFTLLTRMQDLLQEFLNIFCLIFRFGHIFVICSNDLLILRMDLINYQNVITVFGLFVQSWYLLNTVAVFFVTTYLTAVMIAARKSVVIS